MSERSYKYAILLGVSIGVLILLYPFYRRLTRTLRAAFGETQGTALLALVGYGTLIGGTLLFVLAGLYFVAVS